MKTKIVKRCKENVGVNILSKCTRTCGTHKVFLTCPETNQTYMIEQFALQPDFLTRPSMTALIVVIGEKRSLNKQLKIPFFCYSKSLFSVFGIKVPPGSNNSYYLKQTIIIFHQNYMANCCARFPQHYLFNNVLSSGLAKAKTLRISYPLRRYLCIYLRTPCFPGPQW